MLFPGKLISDSDVKRLESKPKKPTDRERMYVRPNNNSQIKRRVTSCLTSHCGISTTAAGLSVPPLHPPVSLVLAGTAARVRAHLGRAFQLSVQRVGERGYERLEVVTRGVLGLFVKPVGGLHLGVATGLKLLLLLLLLTVTLNLSK